MDGNMSGGAERTICMFRPIVMGVRHLHHAENDDQKNADQREENSPRTVYARLSVVSSHIFNYNVGRKNYALGCVDGLSRLRSPASSRTGTPSERALSSLEPESSPATT
jgi:hypothetical protein